MRMSLPLENLSIFNVRDSVRVQILCMYFAAFLCFFIYYCTYNIDYTMTSSRMISLVTFDFFSYFHFCCNFPQLFMPSFFFYERQSFCCHFYYFFHSVFFSILTAFTWTLMCSNTFQCLDILIQDMDKPLYS